MDHHSILQHASSLNELLGVAVRAASVAGAGIKQAAHEIHAIERKGVGDLVSEVDREADRVISTLLADATSLPILSEELNADCPSADRFWIVDPLDASGAFLLQAGPVYPSVLIALRDDNQTEIAVAYFPLTGEWFYAGRGRGAWHNGKRLVCDSNERLADVWVEMNQYGDASYETPFFASLRTTLRSSEGAQLVTCNVPNSGVALRIALGTNALAAAIHDNNPLSPKQAAWDIVAPQLILEEAGGVFLSPTGAVTEPFLTEPIIVSRSRAVAEEIIQLARQAEPSS